MSETPTDKFAALASSPDQADLGVRRLAAGAFRQVLAALADAAERGAVDERIVMALLARWVRESEGQLAHVPESRRLPELAMRLADDAEHLRLLSGTRIRAVLAHVLSARSADLADGLEEALRDAESEARWNDAMVLAFDRLGLAPPVPLSKPRAEDVLRASDKRMRTRQAARERRRRLRRLDGLPVGRGQSAKTIARRNELLTRFTELPPEAEPWELFLTYGAARGFVDAHMERHGIGYDVAQKDWRVVMKMLLGRGLAPILTPLWVAASTGDTEAIARESARLVRFKKRMAD